MFKLLAPSTSDKPSSSKYPKLFREYKGKPIGMNEPKAIKQAVVSYGLLSPFVRKMVKTWALSNKTGFK